jgi:hypothetical protein
MANQSGNKAVRPVTTKIVLPAGDGKKSLGGKGGNTPPPKPPTEKG